MKRHCHAAKLRLFYLPNRDYHLTAFILNALLQVGLHNNVHYFFGQHNLPETITVSVDSSVSYLYPTDLTDM